MKKQTNAADETLVALYAQGNNEAFDILLNRYKDRLYAYIYYTVRNEELAEDIFQETFTKAIVTIQAVQIWIICIEISNFARSTNSAIIIKTNI